MAILPSALNTITSIGSMRIQPIDVRVFNAEGKISSMKAYWSPADVTPLP